MVTIHFMMKHLSLVLLLILLPIPGLSLAKQLQVVDFTPQELKTIQGHYSTIAGYVFINVAGKQVNTEINGRQIQLIKKSDGRIYPQYKLLRLFPISLGSASFSLKSNKKAIQIVMHSKDKKHRGKTAITETTRVVAQKFTPLSIPQLWKQRLGAYKAVLIKGKSKIKKIRLAIKRGVLVAYINKLKSPYPLLALSANKLFSPTAGHNKDQKITIASLKNALRLSYGINQLMLTKQE